MVLHAALEGISTGFEVENAELIKRLGISASENKALMGALNFFVLVASTATEQPADSTITALVDSDIVQEADRTVASAFFTALLRDRATLTGSFRRAEMSSEVLPSLTTFETTIDVRIAFEADRVALALPVLLLHIDTDATNRELWFQMSRRQVEKAIDDLRKAVEQMDHAEKWAAQRKQ